MLFGKKSGSDKKPAQPEPASAAPAATTKQAAVPPNGAQTLSSEEVRNRIAAAKQIAATFGEIVTLLMRTPSEDQHTLKDLEWMVIPAITRGQFALAEVQSKETGGIMPVGVVLWAFVSEEVDKRLSDPSLAAVRLATAEWKSGEIPWIILSCGDLKVLGGLLEQLAKTVFKDRPAKIRAKNADGKVIVGRLGVAVKPAATD